MKRLFVVVALLGMMVGLKFLEVEGSGVAEPLTLAAIGFVVLAAFAVAELLAKVGLPKVTGYILSGVVLGPFVGDVLTTDVVKQMGMFKTLAVGLIALTAGLELELKSLAKLARTLLTTVGAKVVVTAPLVGAALIACELSLHPLGLDDTGQAVALGLVFGALSLGTSPAIALAVVSETRAKGRLAELVLGAAVLKDLVVVVVLAVAVAVAKSMIGAEGGGEGEHGHAEPLWLMLSKELGFSVAAGAVIGGLLIAYLHWIQAEMLLFVAATVLVGAEFAEAFHLELLLIFIVAGFTVRNFSPYEHDLLHPLEMVSLPVFVVFFTTAGAAIDLEATWQVLPVALLLVAVRAGGFWVSAFIGNRVGDESEAVAKNAWFSYLPQAGVTLGLVDIAAARLGEPQDTVPMTVRAVGMAFVALNLLSGPLALRAGLSRAGEIPKDDEGEAGEDDGGLAGNEGPTLVPLDPLSADLARRLEQLRQRLDDELDVGVAKLIGPWVQLRRRAFAHFDPSSIQEITALAENPPRSDSSALANALAALFEQAANHAQRLDMTLAVPLEPRWLEADPSDGLVRRVRRALRRAAVRVGSRRAKTRELPLRLVGREAFEPRLATGMLELFRASCRAEARLADTLRRRLEGSLPPEVVRETLDVVLDEFAADAQASVDSMLAGGVRRMHLLLARIDSPSMPISELDFSEAAKGIERELGTLLAEAEAWPEVIDSCWQTVEVSARIRRLDDRIAGSRDGAADLRAARDALDEELSAFARRLRALRETLDSHESVDDEELDAVSTRARGLLPKPASKRLRQVEQRLRRSSDSRAIQQALREAAARDTGAKRLVGPELVVAAPIPAQIRARELDVRELIDGEIAGRVLPTTERELDNAARLVSEAQQAAATMVGDVELLTEVYRRRESQDATLANLRAGLERVQVRCEALHADAVAALGAAAEVVAVEFDGLGDRLAASLHDATGTGDPTRWVSRRTNLARREVGRRFGAVLERVSGIWAKLRDRLANVTTALTSDYRLRAGLNLPSATAIAKLIEADSSLNVGPDYAALFSDQPIRDPRFFVVNRELLRALNRAERGWQQRRSANAVLIVGGPGSGKTSLLNVASLKLATRDVIRLPETRAGFVAALAAELHCPAEFDAVLPRLLDRQRVVMIDDLERRLPLGAGSIEALEQLTLLISRTGPSCFWIVTASTELQRALVRGWPLRVGFSELIELSQLDAEALAPMILTRHRISHLELRFPISPLRGLLGTMLEREFAGQERDYFEALAHASGSSLRAALTYWCRAASLHDETLVLDGGLRGRSLPFVRQLPATALAILALLLRYGPTRPAELAAELRRDEAELARWLHFLDTADLVERDDLGRLLCPPTIRDVLTGELIELALLHQEVG